MRSSEAKLALAIAVASVGVGMASGALAAEPQAARGFAVERFYPSAPGAGWMVMDDLAMHGGIGGALSVSGGYARGALRVTDGVRSLRVVSDQAFTDLGMAVTYERVRVYLDLTSPIAVRGEGGVVGAYSFTRPVLDLGRNPDTLSDTRVGFDARLVGDATSRFRLGAGAQLFIPSGEREDYVTDGTYRAMGRALFAGELGRFMIAGQLGLHLRPLNDSPTPGSPRGSELLFGVAAGPRFAIGDTAALVVGPELYGETAFRGFFGGQTTGLEGLLTGRLERARDDGPQLRWKIGAGGGLHPELGAPEWRAVVSVELSDHVR